MREGPEIDSAVLGTLRVGVAVLVDDVRHLDGPSPTEGAVRLRVTADTRDAPARGWISTANGVGEAMLDARDLLEYDKLLKSGHLGTLPPADSDAPAWTRRVEDAAGATSTCTFSVLLHRRPGSPLGIQVDHSDGRTLEVQVVAHGGAFASWNELHLHQQVCSGDRIVAVNGCSGNAAALVEELSTQEVLQVTLEREVPAKPPPTDGVEDPAPWAEPAAVASQPSLPSSEAARGVGATEGESPPLPPPAEPPPEPEEAEMEAGDLWEAEPWRESDSGEVIDPSSGVGSSSDDSYRKRDPGRWPLSGRHSVDAKGAAGDVGAEMELTVPVACRTEIARTELPAGQLCQRFCSAEDGGDSKLFGDGPAEQELLETICACREDGFLSALLAGCSVGSRRRGVHACTGAPAPEDQHAPRRGHRPSDALAS